MDREDSNPQTIANDEYDFLRPKSPSSTPKARFDDIPSAAVSSLVHAGLVFWGPNPPKPLMKEESDPTVTTKPLDSAASHALTHDGSEEHEDPQPRAEELAETPTSVPDAETDDRLAAIERRTGQQYNNSDLETHTKLPDETGCVVI
jgi:hypothetical protein